MKSYNKVKYAAIQIIEISYGQAVNLVTIILMIKPIIVIFVMAIITAERLLTTILCSCKPTCKPDLLRV